MAEKRLIDVREGYSGAGSDVWFWADALEPDDDLRPLWETIPGLPRPEAEEGERTSPPMTEQVDTMAKLRAAFDLPTDGDDAAPAVEEKGAGGDLLTRLRRLVGWPAVEKRYNPDQPRVPKGDPQGGQWTDEVVSPDQRGRYSPVETAGLISLLLEKQGFSYQVFDDYSPKDDYMLSIYPERGDVFPLAEANKTRFGAFVNKNKDLLQDKAHFFGGWLDKETGEVCLDVSVRMDSAEEAARACCEHDQKAYWDVKKKMEVRVEC